MTDTSGRFDRFVLIACGLFAALMAGLTFGAADRGAGIPGLGLRYLALYHPTGSTDALVVAFWWVPTLLVVSAATAAMLWLRSRGTGRPAFIA